MAFFYSTLMEKSSYTILFTKHICSCSFYLRNDKGYGQDRMGGFECEFKFYPLLFQQAKYFIFQYTND